MSSSSSRKTPSKRKAKDNAELKMSQNKVDQESSSENEIMDEDDSAVSEQESIHEEHGDTSRGRESGKAKDFTAIAGPLAALGADFKFGSQKKLEEVIRQGRKRKEHNDNSNEESNRQEARRLEEERREKLLQDLQAENAQLKASQSEDAIMAESKDDSPQKARIKRMAREAKARVS
jgi:hypothetical protein